MSTTNLPSKGHLSKQFMAVALAVVMGAGALMGVAGPAQAADWENPIPNTTNQVVTQLPGQVLNQVLNNTVRGQPNDQVFKNAGKQTTQQAGNEATAKVNVLLQQSINNIFKR